MKADRIKEKIKDEGRQEARQQINKEYQEWAKNNNIDIPADSPPPWETQGDRPDTHTGSNQQQ